HPMLEVRRDDQGRLVSVEDGAGARDGIVREAVIHVEIDRRTEQAVLDELAADLRRVLADVRAAVEDWKPMRERLRETATELEERPPPVGQDELAEAKALLEWICDDHFTFLGSREYAPHSVP